MNFRKTFFLVSICMLAIGSTPIFAQSPEPIDEILAVKQPLLELMPDGLFISAPASPNLEIMIVRVFNIKGEMMLRTRSHGEAIELLAGDLPDGNYRYEIKSILRLEQPTGQGADYEDSEVKYQTGKFFINNARMLMPDARTDERTDISNNLIGLLGRVVNKLIPQAHAGNLTASSSTPKVFFDNTNLGSGPEWQLLALETLASPSTFRLYDQTNNKTVIQIDGSPNVESSIYIDPDGNISFANGAMFLERATQKLAIGTISPVVDFNIWDVKPQIRFHDEDDTAESEFSLNGGQLSFFGRPNSGDLWKKIMSYNVNAPANSLTIGATGGITVSNSFSVQGGTLSISGGAFPTVWLNNASNNVYQRLNGSSLETLVPFTAQGIPYSYDINAPESSLVVTGNGNVGLGTSQPTEALSIQRVDTGARIKLDSISDTAAPQMIWRRARSSSGNPAAILQGDVLGAFSFRGHDGSNYTGSRGFISVQATENWSPTAQGTQMEFKVTQNGTTAPFAAMLLTNDGKLLINGVQLNVPDYVFEPDYPLMDLDSLNTFVQKNRHLPGIKSADEVHRDGLNLGDGQLALLEKVEELTLYTLQQHQQLKALAGVKDANREILTTYHAQQQRLSMQEITLQKLETALSIQQQRVEQLLGGENQTHQYTSLK